MAFGGRQLKDLKVVFQAAQNSFFRCETLETIAKDPNLLLGTGFRILHTMINNPAVQSDAIAYMVANGADTTLCDAQGNDALFYAVLRGREDMVRLLIDHNVLQVNKLQETRNDRQSLLHVAAANGYVRIADMLVTAGADINALDAYSQSPLAAAVQRRHADMIEYLLSKGADVALYEEKTGKSLCAIARANCFTADHAEAAEAVVPLLTDRGAKDSGLRPIEPGAVRKFTSEEIKQALDQMVKTGLITPFGPDGI